jgi:hypothetical protein
MSLELVNRTPALPLELEREIFEKTALMHHREIPTLLRVARRVLVWRAFRFETFSWQLITL